MLVTVAPIVKAVSERTADTSFVIKADLYYCEVTERFAWRVKPSQLKLAGCKHYPRFARKDGLVSCRVTMLVPVYTDDYNKVVKRMRQCG